jgi:hypothetical protein
MTTTEIGAVAVATVTVAVEAAGNSRGRKQSTTRGSVVAKTAAAVATAAVAAAAVATAAADNSRTGGQDVSVALQRHLPWLSPPSIIVVVVVIAMAARRHWGQRQELRWWLTMAVDDGG